MIFVKPSAEILDQLDADQVYKKIESCGRVCYKSEGNINDDSYKNFIRSIIKRGHESVLEHFSFSVKFICDRGISHEIVRHRIASFSQESTRYCNYGSGKFNSELTMIDQSKYFKDESSRARWLISVVALEQEYLSMLEHGESPEIARSVLPTCLKTEVVMTANIREWRHFLKLRTSKASHPQIRDLAFDLLGQLKKIIPLFFEDIEMVTKCNNSRVIHIKGQKVAIYNELITHGKVDVRNGTHNLDINSFTARISEMRKLGIPIRDHTIERLNGKGKVVKYKEYYLGDMTDVSVVMEGVNKS